MRETIGVEPFTGGTAEGVAVDTVVGVGSVQLLKVVVGAEGEARDVTDADGMPIKVAALPLPAGASTETTLAALKSAVDALSATVTALSAKITECDTGNIVGSVLANTGLAQPLTDAQLRATAVPVATGLSQPLTDTQLRAAAVPVDTSLAQPLTDAQLRAASVPTTDAATQAIVQAIAEMSEGVQMALIALLDKTPLPTFGDAGRVVCFGDNAGNVILGSSYNTFNVNGTSNPNNGAQYFRTMEPWHFADMGAARLYSNITVS